MPSIGPRGFLGIPPRKFRERTLPIETTTRITQVGLEAWNRYNPEARFTQVGVEVWISLGGRPRRLVNVYLL